MQVEGWHFCRGKDILATRCIVFINTSHQNKNLFRLLNSRKLHVVKIILQGDNNMSAAPLSKYKTIETTVGAVINGAFSLLFVFIVFGDMELVPMRGESGLFIDSIPQGLAIGFMGAFFPSFLTRKRIKSGQLKLDNASQGHSFLPFNPVLRALVFATFGAVLSVSFFAILTFVANISSVAFTQAALLKTIWGICLGAIVAAITIRLALKDYGSLAVR